MWEMSKEHGVKPWEYQNSYDERGCPIMYQEDILVFKWLDEKEALYQYRASKQGSSGKAIGTGGGIQQPAAARSEIRR
jgi:hypothetical protein